MSFTLLMRHGQSEGNAKRIFCGRRTDCPLTPKGIAEVKTVAGKLAGLSLKQVYTSPMRRTVETAEIVSAAIGKKCIIDDRFTEVDMGELEGRSIEQVSKEDSEWYSEFYEEKASKYRLEKYASVTRRVMDGIHYALRGNPDSNILIITHMDPIKCVVADVLNVQPEATQRIHIGNASITIIQMQSSKPRLMAVNVMDLQAYFTYLR